MKFNKSSGQASRTIIILLIVVFLAGLMVYFGLRFAGGRQAAVVQEEVENTDPAIALPPKPVYEAQMGDIKISLVAAYDMGNVLVRSTTNFDQNPKTTEKFIKVLITAENTGKVNTQQNLWGMNEVYDIDGRVFHQIGYAADYFLPRPNGCGWTLKPGFSPTICGGIFEVAKGSNELKVKIYGPQEKGAEPVFLDLPVTKL